MLSASDVETPQMTVDFATFIAVFPHDSFLEWVCDCVWRPDVGTDLSTEMLPKCLPFLTIDDVAVVWLESETLVSKLNCAGAIGGVMFCVPRQACAAIYSMLDWC